MLLQIDLDKLFTGDKGDRRTLNVESHWELFYEVESCQLDMNIAPLHENSAAVCHPYAADGNFIS